MLPIITEGEKSSAALSQLETLIVTRSQRTRRHWIHPSGKGVDVDSLFCSSDFKRFKDRLQEVKKKKKKLFLAKKLVNVVLPAKLRKK